MARVLDVSPCPRGGDQSVHRTDDVRDGPRRESLPRARELVQSLLETDRRGSTHSILRWRWEVNERIDGIETGDPSDENDVVAVWALDLVPFRIVEGWLLVVNVSLALVTGRRWH